MSKKKIIIIISCVLVIGLLATGSYFLVFNPIKIEGSEIEVKSNDEDVILDLKEAIKDKSKDLNLKEYKNKLPSKNYKDYRRVRISYNVKYKSIFKMESFAAVSNIDEFKDKRLLMSYTGEGNFDGDSPVIARNIDKGYNSASFIIYVKGMSKDEIKDLAIKIADNIQLKIAYNMQWIGNKDMTIDKGKVSFKEYSLWNFNTGDIKTDKLN